VDWGPGWCWLRRATSSAPLTGLGWLEPPAGVPIDDAPVPGGLIDNAFGLGMWCVADRLRERGDDVPNLPFGVERFVWHGHHSAPAWAQYSHRQAEDPAADMSLSDLAFWDAQGVQVATMEGFISRRAPQERFLPDATERHLYAVEWERAAAAAQPDPQHWAFIGNVDLQAGLLAGQHVTAWPTLAALESALDQGHQMPHAIALGYLEEPADPLAGAYHATLQLVDQLKAWLASERLGDCPLAVLTRDAAVVGAASSQVNLAHAPLWGLVRSVQAEQPQRRLLIADLDGDPASLAALPAALASNEPQLALRAGTTWVPRLARVPRLAMADRGMPSITGTVLVTGGTGGLGALVARHLVQRHGVRNLVLTSRQGLAANGARELQAQLEALGAVVTIAACDVADREALRGLFQTLDTLPPLAGVVHTAGVVDDALLESLGADQVRRTLAPKVNGAQFLHELTRDRQLAFFVLFSSAAGLLGNAGQGGYAAANAFMDALAAQRRALGLPALSLAWGPWADAGMASRLPEAVRARLYREGLPPLPSDLGLALFDAALLRPEAVLLPAAMDMAQLSRSALAASPLMRGLLKAALPQAKPSRPAQPAQPGVAPFKQRLATLDADQRAQAVLELVSAEVAAVLGMPGAHGVDPNQPLRDVGLDSLMAVDLRNRLGAAIGLRLPATLLFDYATPSALAKRLLDDCLAGLPAPEEPFLAELARLEGLLSPAKPDAEARARVASRLQALLASLGAQEAPAPSQSFKQAIEAASAEELFSLIDQALG
jgi:NAD(P)-dependent dehydrogenase (short-subunit alcohol dehydrogenase family)/acyl carrier protein